MSAYYRVTRSYRSSGSSGFCQPVQPHPGKFAQLSAWCIAHGASKDLQSGNKIIIDGAFIDFYDEEMYTMFKLRWG